jgi:hypothetical protein
MQGPSGLQVTSVREQFFSAFRSLEKQGVKPRDVIFTELAREMKSLGLDRGRRDFSPSLFHQYRYLYLKEGRKP